jgi:hypothetical protein
MTNKKIPGAGTPGSNHKKKYLQSKSYNKINTIAILRKIANQPHDPIVRILAEYFALKGELNAN